MRSPTALPLLALCFVLPFQGAFAQSWTAEVYGGVVLERSEDYSQSPGSPTAFDLDSGTALGLGLYTDAWVPGFELGLDLMSTRAGYTGFATGVNTLSLMAVARVPFQLGSTVEGYVGAGLGAIRVEYDGADQFPTFTGNETVAGGQVSLGVRYGLSAQTGFFAEIKHQAAFDDADFVAPAARVTQSYGATSVVVGLSFDF